jgi:hypothetical protein
MLISSCGASSHDNGYPPRRFLRHPFELSRSATFSLFPANRCAQPNAHDRRLPRLLLVSNKRHLIWIKKY